MEMKVRIFLLALALGVAAAATPEFNVLNFGAVGNGRTDDSKAFLKAWEATCGAATGSPTLVVPAGRTFLLNPVKFSGPCNSTNVNFQITGMIMAPDTLSAWNGLDPSLWLAFDGVNGLGLWGHGTVNGRGSGWWEKSCKKNPKPGCTTEAPTALLFLRCVGLHLSNVTSLDSPQIHIGLVNSQWVYVYNLRITAPESSPNTDGIHIEASQHVSIDSTVVGSGDDCISIGNGSNDVNISHISCGPGHGISVGSLGKGGTYVAVENIRVSYSNFHGTTNGARIKTWQGATGYARGITFEHLNFTDVGNPIIIDQYYCDSTESCQNKTEAVQISNISYSDAYGTSHTNFAVSLNCSQASLCTRLLFNNVILTATNQGQKASSYCINAQGYAEGYVQPWVPCLKLSDGTRN